MGDPSISRRDFLGGVLVGSGLTLLDPGKALAAESVAPFVGPVQDLQAAAQFNGPGGTGDYVNSHGNTWQVVASAHRIRDGAYTLRVLESAKVTDDLYDLVIVGGGAAGLGASYTFISESGRKGRALLLDNHPVFGGEAKQNEFLVDGVRLIAPQGSNLLFTARGPNATPGEDYLYPELVAADIPVDFRYATLTGTERSLQFDRTNYMFLYAEDHSDSVGLFLDDDRFGHSRRWLNNPWRSELRGLGMPESLRTEMLRFRHSLQAPSPPPGMDLHRWLDTQTYRQLLTETHRLPVEVADFMEPFVASGVGLGSSVVSAYAATGFLPLPGAAPGSSNTPDLGAGTFGPVEVNGFPGGNGTVARAFLRYINPRALPGHGFDSVVTAPIRFTELDRPDLPVRVRLGATVVDVRHQARAGRSDIVQVTYEKGGRLYRTHAKAVVMANGSWVSKHIVSDLPTDIHSAMDSFNYSSVLVANVALRNWRFLERLGLTACIYTGGDFGFSCNVRRPMQVSGYSPPLDPGQPIVLTFYAPVVFPGQPARVQAAGGRAQVFAMAYRDFETRIRRQMTRMFADAGFDAGRDIAGIVLNRWGHAYIVPEPGFFFGKSGSPPPSDAIRRGFGRIAFGAAELRGEQNFRGGFREGARAVKQILA